jgi:putative transport protein
MAGGPLLVGLLVAHFGQYLGNAAYMPAAARMLIQELGLALFLADAGFRAGGSFVETFMRYGAAPFGLSLLVVATAVAIAYMFARFFLGMNLLQVLGGTCGAMTSTAGVGAISGATESGVPVASYAAAYPASLVMMTLLAQVLIAVTS